jgi:uncharacterized protein
MFGSRCDGCGEVMLGAGLAWCPRCSRAQPRTVELSCVGTVWSYTVIRARPPGPSHFGEQFEPFVSALVELPEKLRILSPLAVPIDRVAIGAPVELQVYVLYTDDATDVMAFCYGEPGGGA